MHASPNSQISHAVDGESGLPASGGGDQASCQVAQGAGRPQGGGGPPLCDVTLCLCLFLMYLAIISVHANLFDPDISKRTNV